MKKSFALGACVLLSTAVSAGTVMDEANCFLGPDAARTGSPCFLAVAGIVTLELLPRQIVFLEIE